MNRAIAALAAVALIVTAGCSAATPPATRVVIATGGEGGVYHALGLAFAGVIKRRWSIPATALTTAAAIQNLRLVAAGQADVGFTTVDSAALAIKGTGPFTTPLPIVALAGLYDDYLQIVVRASGPIH